MKLARYKDQVELLLSVIPSVAKETCFALKGGTGINLFVRDLPRLSVDIDLTYLGDKPRDEALPLVESALKRIKADIETRLPKTRVFGSHRESLDHDMKLFVERNGAQIKIEANPVIRGTLFEPETRMLVAKAVELFEVEVETPVVHLADLYGGKIVAALDRQHPRDLFDVKQLYENGGLAKEMRAGFLVYLLSHSRPFHEVIRPTYQDMRSVFENEFEGMTEVPFSYADFEEVRERLVADILQGLTDKNREFLVSFASGEPDWSLAPDERVQALPAVRWKLQNIDKMNSEKRNRMVAMLKEIMA